jgi:hypothetical protein
MLASSVLADAYDFRRIDTCRPERVQQALSRAKEECAIMHMYEERPWESTHVEEQGMHAPSPVIRLHPNDDVVIARHQLVGGTCIPAENLTVTGLIPPGHKVATRNIDAGQPVHRYD